MLEVTSNANQELKIRLCEEDFAKQTDVAISGFLERYKKTSPPGIPRSRRCNRSPHSCRKLSIVEKKIEKNYGVS